MVENLSPQKIFEFITGDFEDAWNSLASTDVANSRGNFMFALHAMIPAGVRLSHLRKGRELQ